MNELIIAQNETAYTTSNTTAITFEKNHKHILDIIDKLIEDLTAEKSAVKNYFVKSTHLNARNREYRNYLMTRDGFTLVAMGLNGKKAMGFKLQYIEAFNQMEKFLKDQSFSRMVGIEARKKLTEHIQESGENERMHGHGFSTYTKMAYKTIGIKYVKPKKGERFRDSLSPEDLSRLKDVEGMIKGAVKAGKQYGDVKEMISMVFGDNQKKLEGK